IGDQVTLHKTPGRGVGFVANDTLSMAEDLPLSESGSVKGPMIGALRSVAASRNDFAPKPSRPIDPNGFCFESTKSTPATCRTAHGLRISSERNGAVACVATEDQ